GQDKESVVELSGEDTGCKDVPETEDHVLQDCGDGGGEVSAGENGLTRVPVKPFGSASRKAVDESDLHQPEEVTKDNDADHDMESEAKKQKIDSENESNDQNISNHRPTGKETASGKRT